VQVRCSVPASLYKNLREQQLHCNNVKEEFLARDSIYTIARSLLMPVRPSLCLSHGWISQRRLKLGSRNLYHKVAPWLQFLGA